MSKDLYRKQRSEKRKRKEVMMFRGMFGKAKSELLESLAIKKLIEWDIQEAEKDTVEVPFRDFSIFAAKIKNPLSTILNHF